MIFWDFLFCFTPAGGSGNLDPPLSTRDDQTKILDILFKLMIFCLNIQNPTAIA